MFMETDHSATLFCNFIALQNCCMLASAFFLLSIIYLEFEAACYIQIFNILPPQNKDMFEMAPGVPATKPQDQNYTWGK